VKYEGDYLHSTATPPPKETFLYLMPQEICSKNSQFGGDRPPLRRIAVLDGNADRTPKRHTL
jgi:hypothetical protein